MHLTSLLVLVSGVASLILGVWALVDLWPGPNGIGAKTGWAIQTLLLPILIAGLYLVSRPGSRMQQEACESADDIIRAYGHVGELRR